MCPPSSWVCLVPLWFLNVQYVCLGQALVHARAITWVWDSHYMLLIKKGVSPGRVLRVPYLIVLTHYLAFHLFMSISKYFQAHSFSRLEAAKVQDINSGDGARWSGSYKHIRCKMRQNDFWLRIAIERSQSHGWLFDEDHPILHNLRENLFKIFLLSIYFPISNESILLKTFQRNLNLLLKVRKQEDLSIWRLPGNFWNP